MAIRSDEARVDIATRSFWVTAKMAFFEVTVFKPIAMFTWIFQKNISSTKNNKKKNYNERILEVEHGSFTPIVMSAYGGIGKEGNKFFNRLAELLAEKKNQQLPVMASWISRQLIFALINSICICISGSRSLPNKFGRLCTIEHVRIHK